MLARYVMAAALLAVAVPAVAQPTPFAAQVRPISGTRLDVLASGAVARVPNIVNIDAGISAEAPTAAEAIRANGAAMDQLRASLRRAGIESRDIQTSSVHLSGVTRHQVNGPAIFVGYRATHRLDIRFRDVANAGRILDTLVAAGAAEISGISFEIEETEAMREEARNLALAEARGRADRYARSLGMRVVRVLAVSERGGSASSGYATVSNDSDRANMSNIALGEETLEYALAVTFELE